MKIASLLMILILSGCASVNNTFQCNSPHDSFKFTNDDVTVVHSEQTGVEFYLINTTTGENVNLSSEELAKYTCQ